MKNWIFLLGILVLSAFSNPNDKTAAMIEAPEMVKEDSCGQIPNVFGDGESITMKISYNWKRAWVHAGEVEFRTEEEMLNGRKVFHVTALGSTYKSYDWIYKVRDRYETYIDVETLKPLKYKRDVSEGGYKFKWDYEFDHEKKEAKARYERKGKVKESVVKFSDACTQDILSAIFYTRSMDFSKVKEGEVIPMPLVLDGKEYNDLYVRYIGKEILETDYGKFRCIKFSPMLVDGTIFEGGEKMTVWATDDNNRIPLMVESPLVVGNIRAHLKSTKNIKNPLTSKIE